MKIDRYWDEPEENLILEGKMDLPGVWARDKTRAVTKSGRAALSPLAAAILNQVDPPQHPYFNDPIGWITAPKHMGGLGEWIWSKQGEICESVRDNKHTAVRAGHGLGKSRIAVMIMAWWACTRPRKDVWITWTAPTQPQVEIIIGRELKALFARHPELDLEVDGNMSLKEKSTKTPLGIGRKPADHDESGFQGQHAIYLLAVMDEAGGIVDQMWRAVETIVTNESSRILAIGNPDDPISDFRKKFETKSDGSASSWNKIKIAVRDSPNYTGEYVPNEDIKQALTAATWADEMAAEYGEKSPFYVSKVMAEFPEEGADTLITIKMVRAAQSPERLAKLARIQSPQAIGMDVATHGTDYSVGYLNVGGKLSKIHSAFNDSTTITAHHMQKLLQEHPQADGVIDSIGVGAGVYDIVSTVLYNRDIIPFNASNRAFNPAKFINRRAEIYWHAREMFEAGKIYLDPADTQLANEIVQLRYKFVSGKIQIESKDDYRKRVGKSPDHADAAVMSLIHPEMKEFMLQDAYLKYGPIERGPGTIFNPMTPEVDIVSWENPFGNPRSADYTSDLLNLPM